MGALNLRPLSIFWVRRKAGSPVWSGALSVRSGLGGLGPPPAGEQWARPLRLPMELARWSIGMAEPAELPRGVAKAAELPMELARRPRSVAEPVGCVAKS